MPILSRNTLLTDGHRWTFRILAGALSAIAIAAMILGPVTVWADNWSLAGISVVAVEVFVRIAGLSWLALLSLAPRRR